MRLPGAIFLLLCGFYLLTMSGHTYSPDEETMLAVTRGLIERRGVAWWWRMARRWRRCARGAMEGATRPTACFPRFWLCPRISWAA